MSSRRSANIRWIALAIGVLSLGIAWAAVPRTEPRQTPLKSVAIVAPAPVRHPVQLHLPVGLGTIDSGLRNVTGEPIGIACSNCHALHAEPPFIQKATDLKRFHKDLQLVHGELQCGACHDPTDRDKLRLADERRIPMQDVVQLCGQCHGPQLRDWKHGAHGGMSGHWDLAKGGRVRNACVDCHDPHQPKYPTYAPVQKPRDRFLQSPHGDAPRHDTPHAPPVPHAPTQAEAPR